MQVTPIDKFNFASDLLVWVRDNDRDDEPIGLFARALFDRTCEELRASLRESAE